MPRPDHPNDMCLSRKLEAVYRLDFFCFPPHSDPADFYTLQHALMRRSLMMLPILSALLALNWL
jgi:hypothetical protein